MNFCETANYHGYYCEEHKNVQTPDGYLLTIHRINGRLNEKPKVNRKAVFMQHGLLSSSYGFIMNLPNNSLPFIFSDAGFDVWLGNSRGNTYSMKHIKYNDKQKEFWDFSWQEMAMYDLPTSLDFVLKITNTNSIPYIGHSQGTLIAFAHEAMTKSKKISHLIALAPIFHVTNIEGPYRLLIPFKSILGRIFEDIDNGKFLPSSNSSRWDATHLCNHPLLVDICDGVLFVTMGYDAKYLNQSRMPVYAAHTPEGCSVKDILHYAQMVKSGNCSFYDYGSAKENMEKYNRSSPPIINAQDITTPVTLFSAEKDILADAVDVSYLRQHLPNIINDVYVTDWDHADFIIATNLPSKIARLLIDILSYVN
ncbi:gastric triacylglycerol lipase-like [Watersipora subatra]|uniref:gastric triacylglycerol lipase-like n=1 Tax=Watersipora subatra TaxID=2589382 RepID=UPI00355B4C38